MALQVNCSLKTFCFHKIFLDNLWEVHICLEIKRAIRVKIRDIRQISDSWTFENIINQTEWTENLL